jgi:diguanylate cyclase (GGDEF)-like protein
MLLLPGTGDEALEAVAERLRKAVARSKLQVDGNNISISASIGATEFNFEGESWQACLKRADDAMYRAKHAGRDRISLAVDSDATKPVLQ